MPAPAEGPIKPVVLLLTCDFKDEKLCELLAEIVQAFPVSELEHARQVQIIHHSDLFPPESAAKAAPVPVAAPASDAGDADADAGAGAGADSPSVAGSAASSRPNTGAASARPSRPGTGAANAALDTKKGKEIVNRLNKLVKPCVHDHDVQVYILYDYPANLKNLIGLVDNSEQYSILDGVVKLVSKADGATVKR
jgi:hypothetical protein